MPRLNLVPNPSFETTILGCSVAAGTGGTATVSRQSSGGYSGSGFLRAAWTVASTAAGTIVATGSGYRAVVTPLGLTRASLRVRPSLAHSLRLVAVTSTAVTAGTTTVVNAGYVSCAAGTWTELALNLTPAAGRGFLELQVQSQGAVSVGTIDVDAVMVLQGDLTGLYFDGSTVPFDAVTPDGQRPIHGWTGTAHASTSTETLSAPAIEAELVAAGDPAPVQIVVRPANGEAYRVIGTALGSSWPVPGGVGVGDGSQVVLVDNRGGINVPITYSVALNGATFEAPSLIVALPGIKVVIQSLDGQTSVLLDDFRANGLPRETVVNSHATNVPGRRRAPVRYATGGDGGGSYVIRTDRAGSEAMFALLHDGAPVVVRTDGVVRDHATVEIALITQAPSSLWEGTRGGDLTTDRVWQISFILVDDPEPSARLAAYTWDDIDALNLTWDQVNALNLTWDQAERYDWGQLA